jgi:hypothetical protein
MDHWLWITPRVSSKGLVETRGWLPLIVPGAVVAVVVSHQFLTRRTVRSFIIAGSGCILTGLSALLWRWDLEAFPPEPAAPPSAVADRISISLSQITLVPQRPPFPVGGLSFGLTARGIPDELGMVTYWGRFPFRSEHLWRWPDGVTYSFSNNMGFVDGVSYSSSNIMVFEASEMWADRAVRKFLGVSPLNPDSRRNELIIEGLKKLHEGRPLIVRLSLPGPVAARMAKEPPAYTAKLNFLLVRPEVEYGLPLRASNRERHGSSSLRIARAAVREDGRMFVSLIESRPEPRIEPENFTLGISGPFDPKVYALVNRSRSEAVLIHGYGSNQEARIGTVAIRWNTLAFSAPLEQRDGQWVPQEAAWFDGTTFDRVGFVEDTRVSKELKVERFEATEIKGPE